MISSWLFIKLQRGVTYRVRKSVDFAPHGNVWIPSTKDQANRVFSSRIIATVLKVIVHPPAPQGAVPRTHQAHQDQLAISLAEPIWKENYWNPRPAESGLLGLVFFFLALRPTRAPSTSISVTYMPCAAIAIGLRAAWPVSGRPRPPPPRKGWGACARVGLRCHNSPLVI